MKGKTQRFYDKNPKAAAKKKAYDTKFEKKPSQVAKRKELIKVQRKRNIYGKMGGFDLAHTASGLVKKKASVNRGSKSDQPGDKRARGRKKK